MDLIEEHLYLSGSHTADDLKILNIFEIKYVLSVFDDALKHKSDSITYMLIFAADNYSQDLLTHFDETYQFISKAQNSGQNILVHCHAGLSRSATITIAYLMRKHNIPFESAFNMVKCRRTIYPNENFVAQLQLFEEMGNKLNANNKKFRQHILSTVLNMECLWSTKYFNNLEDYFKRRDLAEEVTENLDLGPKCLCVECGQYLFNEIHIIVRMTVKPYAEASSTKACNYDYIEPQKWMTQLEKPFTDANEYQIQCPQCHECVIEYKQKLMQYWCDCSLHSGIRGNCLRFRILKSKYRIESKD